MNHIYRIVWNRKLGMLQAVSECARSSTGKASGAGAPSTVGKPMALLRSVALGIVAVGMGLPTAQAQTVVSGQGGAPYWGTAGGGSSGQGGSAYIWGQSGAGTPGSQGNGGTGGAGYADNAGPGAGGIGGAVGQILTGGATIQSNVAGGAGQVTTVVWPGGGGGGGGAGVYATAAGSTLSIASGVSVRGGDGAEGGLNPAGGGGGGNGIIADGAAITVNNSGVIAGGNGGMGGNHGGPGIAAGGGGGGGNGLTGSGLTVNNSGTITGGTGGRGGSGNGTAGAAVLFLGGNNTLNLAQGSVLNGAVETVSGATSTINAGADGLSLTGGTTGSTALIVNGATTINTNGHAVSLTGAVSGGSTLVVQRAAGAAGTSSDAVTLGSVNIAGLTVGVAATLGGDVVTNGGGQTYTEAVTLNANLTATDNSNGAIRFGGTVDGARDLTVSTGGNVIFGGAVGGATKLSSLTIASTNGTTSLGGNVSTTGDQTYNQAVALANDVTLTGNGISLNSTVDNATSGPARGLTINAGGAVTAGEIGGANGALATLTVNAGDIGDLTQTGAWNVSGAASFSTDQGAIALTAANNFGGTVSLATGATNSQDVSLSNGTHALSLGDVRLGTGTFNLSGGSVSQAAGTKITQAAGAGAVTIDAGSGAITLANSGNQFTGAVSLTGGATQITNAAGLTLASLNTGALTASAAGDLNLGSGSVQGDLDARAVDGDVLLDANNLLTIAGNAALAASGAIKLNGLLNAATATFKSSAGTTVTGFITLSGASGATLSQGDLFVGTATQGGGIKGAAGAGSTSGVGANGGGGVTVGASGVTLTNAADANISGGDGGQGGVQNQQGFSGGQGGIAIMSNVSTNTFTLSNSGSISGGAGGYSQNVPWGNAGTPDIGGAGGAAISSVASFTLTNSAGATITGGNGGGGGSAIGNPPFANGGRGAQGGAGGTAIVGGGGFLLTNNGTIAGGAGGNGGSAFGVAMGTPGTAGGGGAGGDGVSGQGFTLVNNGSIAGGNAGQAGQVVSGVGGGLSGIGGVGVRGSDFTLTNNAGASISGGNGANNVGGVGVLASGNSTITTAGNIQAGSSGSALAAAVVFSNGGNTLTLQNGYSFTRSGGGAASVLSASGNANGGDTLGLGGGSNGTFDVSRIVWDAPAGTPATTQFIGFSNFVKSGASTWTLVGDGSGNTGTGGSPGPGVHWTITGGTLQGDATSITGNVNFNPVAGGTATLAFNQGSGNANSAATGTYAGRISGNGVVAKLGDGTLILTGQNSYSGGTTIQAGTLQVGDGTTDGAIGTGNVQNSGRLAFNNASDMSMDGVISGSGTLRQQGPGTLTLTANNTYTGATVIDPGATLALAGAGSIAQSSNVAVGGTFDVSRVASRATVQNLSGAGTVNLGAKSLAIANGSGTFDGKFAGTAASRLVKQGGGLLIVNGDSSAFAGTTEVAGGTLEVGDINTPSARLGGTVLVGSAGTLRGHGTILGDVMNNGIVMPGGSIGTLTVNGNYMQANNATLTLEVSPTEASQLRVNGTATLAGGLSLVYGPGTYNNTRFSLLSANNVVGQFSSVNSNLGANGPLLNYDGASVSLVQNTPLIVAPTGTSIYTALGTTAAMNAQNATASLLQRLGTTAAAGRDGGGDGPGAWTAASAPRVWGSMIGQHTNVGGTGGAPGFKADQYGFLAGIDWRFGEATLGLAGGYTRTDLKERDTGNSGGIDSLRIAGYASRDAGPVNLAAVVGYGVDFLSQKRPFAGVGTARGNHVGQAFTTGIQASLPMQWGGLSITPRAGLRYAYYHANGFDEDGGSSQDLKVGTDNVRSLQPYVELGIGKTFGQDARPVDVQWRVGYAQEVLSSGRSIMVASQDGTRFVAPGTSMPRNFLTTGLSVSMNPTKQLRISLGFDALIDTSHASAQAGTLRASYRF